MNVEVVTDVRVHGGAVGEVLGSGAYGQVFAVGEDRVKKILQPTNHDTPFDGSTLRELAVLTLMDAHRDELRHVVLPERILVGATGPEVEPHVAFVMPRFARTLHDFVRTAEFPLPEDTVRNIMRQILEGLHSLHRIGIIHRDLDLSNVLMRDDGTVAIADFSLATAHPLFAEPGVGGYLGRKVFLPDCTSYVCKRPFRAPELVLGLRRYGPEVDVWAAGATMFTLLAGRNFVPPRGDCMEYILARIPDAERALRERFGDKAVDKATTHTQKREHLAVYEASQDEFTVVLLEDLLQPDYAARVSARNALMYPYFDGAVVPAPRLASRVQAGAVCMRRDGVHPCGPRSRDLARVLNYVRRNMFSKNTDTLFLTREIFLCAFLRHAIPTDLSLRELKVFGLASAYIAAAVSDPSVPSLAAIMKKTRHGMSVAQLHSAIFSIVVHMDGRLCVPNILTVAESIMRSTQDSNRPSSRVHWSFVQYIALATVALDEFMARNPILLGAAMAVASAVQAAVCGAMPPDYALRVGEQAVYALHHTKLYAGDNPDRVASFVFGLAARVHQSSMPWNIEADALYLTRTFPADLMPGKDVWTCAQEYLKTITTQIRERARRARGAKGGDA